ncbi:MAG: hypothetical protein MJB14_14680 [Spirochaetes bacterium]|nr:hypothetical protein [Spirochaetota bacterium]
MIKITLPSIGKEQGHYSSVFVIGSSRNFFVIAGPDFQLQGSIINLIFWKLANEESFKKLLNKYMDADWKDLEDTCF